jgi:hypothetical protein
MAINFKNASGAYLLRGLFYETTDSDKSTVVYTLKNESHEGYPSLKQLYMEVGDPTEYRFAVGYLSGVEHWEKLCDCAWFKPYVKSWRRELELKFRAEALNTIKTIADNETSKDRFAANKFLLEKGWAKEPEGRKAGRPSKQEIQDAANDIVLNNTQIIGDLDRLGIKVN